MTTKELQKINKIEKEIEVLEILVPNTVSYDNEGQYKKTFEKEMTKLSKNKAVFEYSGRGSLNKKLA